MQFDHIQVIKEAVALGSGISILPARTMLAEVEQGRLAAVPLHAPDLAPPLGIVHRKRKKFNRAAQSFLGDAARGAGSSGRGGVPVGTDWGVKRCSGFHSSRQTHAIYEHPKGCYPPVFCFLLHHQQQRNPAHQNRGPILCIRGINQCNLWSDESNGLDHDAWGSHLGPSLVSSPTQPPIQIQHCRILRLLHPTQLRSLSSSEKCNRIPSR